MSLGRRPRHFLGGKRPAGEDADSGWGNTSSADPNQQIIPTLAK